MHNKLLKKYYFINTLDTNNIKNQDKQTVIIYRNYTSAKLDINNILKLKAINRTHSGHSRFIDINDPTGKYQSVTVYGEDGLLYKEDAKDVNTIDIEGSSIMSEIVESLITSKLNNSHLKNFIYEDYRNVHLANDSLVFDLTRNYREAYNIFACNGILFNHESPIRGETFVTKKIIQGLIRIKHGYQKKLFLGNLYSKRDWGHARDYVEAMWKMLQQKKPNDYVIGTGKTFTIKEFVNKAAKKIGLKIKWVGKGINEKAMNIENKKVLIECKKRYFRPLEVDYLKGNAQKAKKLLKWSPKISVDNLIDEMIEHELENL